MVKRRSMVIGLGALATGSGAVFSSATFSNSTASAANLDVVVDQELRAIPGSGPKDAGNSDVYTNDKDDLPVSDDPDSASSDDLPLAYVAGGENEDGEDEDLEIKAAVGSAYSDDDNDPTFPNIIAVSNDTEGPVYVGIVYDRTRGDGSGVENDGNQYGDDIENNDDLTYELAQEVYQFKANGSSLDYYEGKNEYDSLVSPAPDEDGVGDDDNIVFDEDDYPAAAVKVESGSDIEFDLNVDLSDNQDTIEESVDQLTEFGESSTTVDILDAITIVHLKED